MRHTVKALNLIIVVLWIAVLLLPVTVALSIWEIFESRDNLRLGELGLSVLNGNFSILVPFYMNNTGFYDISELCLKIRIYNETEEITEFSTQPLNIPAGKMVSSNLSASISLADVLSKDGKLLTDSKDLNIGVTLHFRAAYILAFNVARNFTYKWGAPFSNLTVDYIGKNVTHMFFSVRFYNNATFTLIGPLNVKLYNLQNVSIGSTVQTLDVPSNRFYQKLLEIPVSEAVEEGIIRLYLADILISEEHWGSS